MLLRRFLLVSCALFVLVVIDVQTSWAQASSSTHGQYIQYILPTLAHMHSALVGEQMPNCPEVLSPTKQGPPRLAFCAPKYADNVGGPYGSHIVVVGENLAQVPSAWIMTKDQPINDTQKLLNCKTQRTDACFPLFLPTQVSTREKTILFSWTWGDGFPTTVGNYFINAIIHTLQDDHPQMIVSTPIAFALLTAQAPCITLDNTNCPSPPSPVQVFPIDLSTTRTLTLSGSNWVLGWEQNPITENVEVTATCAPSQQCSQKTLFDIFIPSSQINTNGGFTSNVPLPIGVSGIYSLSAINHVQSVPSPGNRNIYRTIADGTLSFGEAGDVNTLNMKLIPPILPQNKIHSVVLNFIAAFAILLPLIGIFFFIMIKQRRIVSQFALPVATPIPSPPDQASPIITTAGVQQFTQHSSSSNASATVKISRPLSDKSNVTEAANIEENASRHEYFLVDFPPKVARHTQVAQAILSLFRLIRFLEPDLNKGIQRAVKKWKEEGNLDEAISVAANTLTTDLRYWDTLKHELIIGIPTEIFTQYIKQRAVHATISISIEPRKLRLHCSRALVYYAISPFLMAQNSQESADIQFDMGFAYIKLAAIAPHTASALLEYACRSYEQALTIYKSHSSFESYNRTLVALGDVCFALSELAEAKNNDWLRYREKARQCYEEAQKNGPPLYLQQSIQKRIEHARRW